MYYTLKLFELSFRQRASRQKNAARSLHQHLQRMYSICLNPVSKHKPVWRTCNNWFLQIAASQGHEHASAIQSSVVTIEETTSAHSCVIESINTSSSQEPVTVLQHSLLPPEQRLPTPSPDQHLPSPEEAHNSILPSNENSSQQPLPSIEASASMEQSNPTDKEPPEQQIMSLEESPPSMKELTEPLTSVPPTTTNTSNKYFTRSRGVAPPFAKRLCTGNTLF